MLDDYNKAPDFEVGPQIAAGKLAALRQFLAMSELWQPVKTGAPRRRYAAPAGSYPAFGKGHEKQIVFGRVVRRLERQLVIEPLLPVAGEPVGTFGRALNPEKVKVERADLVVEPVRVKPAGEHYYLRNMAKVVRRAQRKKRHAAAEAAAEAAAAG
eukprot:gene5634-3817_t